MVPRIDTKSLLLGLAIGVVAALGLGAVSKPTQAGPYQLCMAANEHYVFYGRMHTATGRIETWRYFTSRVPSQSDEQILLKPAQIPADRDKPY